MEPNVICKNCGTKIYRSPSYLKKYKTLFCSQKCRSEYRKKNKKVLETKCNYCEKKITKTIAEQIRSKTGLFFCDANCRNQFVWKKRKWANDKVYSYRSRLKILLNESDWSCQKCGYHEYPTMLDIHHYDHNHQNNDTENLRILCVWCHLKHHRLKEEYDLPVLLTEKKMEKLVEKMLRKKLEERAEKKYNKKCIICKKEFETTIKEQIYCSRKCSSIFQRKIKNRPDKEQLIKEVEESNYCAVGRKYMVAGNTIKSWIKGKPKKRHINFKTGIVPPPPHFSRK